MFIVRIPEIGVVEDVGESALGAQVYSFGDGEDFAQAARKIDRARTDDGTDLRITEAADGIRYRADGQPVVGSSRRPWCRRFRASIPDSPGR